MPSQLLAGLADQALYGGANFGALLIAARILGPEPFGAFGLAFGLWNVLWLLGRSVIADPFVIRTSSFSLAKWREEAALASGAVLGVGVLVGVFLGLGASLLPLSPEVRETVLVLALFMPALLLQDYWRVAAFSRGQAGGAIRNDVARVLVQFGALAVLWLSGAFSPSAVLGAWALGGLAGCLVSAAQFRIAPRLGQQTWSWAGEAFRLGGWFGAARGLEAGSLQLVFVVVGLIAGLASLGGLLSVQTLFGPFGMVVRGAEMTALPAMARAHRGGGVAIARQYALTVGAAAVAYGACIVAISGHGLELLYGPSFVSFGFLLLPAALANVALGAGWPAATLLRSIRRVRQLLWLDSLRCITLLSSAVVLTMWVGVAGAAWALCLAGTVHVFALWRLGVKGSADGQHAVTRGREVTPAL